MGVVNLILDYDVFENYLKKHHFIFFKIQTFVFLYF